MLNKPEIMKFFEVAEEEVEKMTDISHYEKNEDQTVTEICQELVNDVKNISNRVCGRFTVTKLLH